ncbi:MAG: hypothetical protein VYE68_14395 [Acidobacteriota bacterium]|nr:hypothetical protein [Acidobacteriota bacterium]
MTDTPQLGLAGRAFLWLVCASIFGVIALLPYELFMRYLPDSTVHVTVASSVAVIALVLLVATIFGPLRVQPLSAVPATGAGLEFLNLIARTGFIALQIVIVPLLIVQLILMLTGSSLF